MSEPILSASLLISTNYALNDVIFQGIDNLWGPHTVDRFACNYNAKLPRFNSQFFQVGCEAVDAFFLRIGEMITIGFVPRFALLSKF